jgi:hypothetical protein
VVVGKFQVSRKSRFLAGGGGLGMTRLAMEKPSGTEGFVFLLI